MTAIAYENQRKLRERPIKFDIWGCKLPEILAFCMIAKVKFFAYMTEKMKLLKQVGVNVKLFVCCVFPSASSWLKII